jgi:hypothetical protein
MTLPFSILRTEMEAYHGRLCRELEVLGQNPAVLLVQGTDCVSRRPTGCCEKDATARGRQRAATGGFGRTTRVSSRRSARQKRVEADAAVAGEGRRNSDICSCSVSYGYICRLGAESDFTAGATPLPMTVRRLERRYSVDKLGRRDSGTCNAVPGYGSTWDARLVQIVSPLSSVACAVGVGGKLSALHSPHPGQGAARASPPLAPGKPPRGEALSGAPRACLARKCPMSTMPVPASAAKLPRNRVLTGKTGS